MADEQAPPIDTTRPPTGELAARRLVEALVRTDDRAERHYLEVKSDIDLTRTLGAAKVAKFILGAANRSVELANRAFGGYAVLVIGVAPGVAPGIPPIEIGEIEERVRPFVTASGPGWDVVRVPVSSDRDVLLVLVDPPVAGQDPFLCWRDFSPSEKSEQKHSLRNGGLYIRTEGSTRPATAEETAALIQRGKTSHPSVDIEVTLVGTAVRPAADPGFLGSYVTKVAAALLRKLPDEEPPVERPVNSLTELAAASSLREVLRSNMPLMNSLVGKTIPEDRTREDYVASVRAWETKARDAIPKFLDELLARVVEPVIVRVANRADTFFEDVELSIHLEGDVAGLEPREEAVSRGDWPPRPPRAWGPRNESSPWATMPGLSTYVPSLPSSYAPPDFSWSNGGSIDGTWSIGDLRPREEVEAFPDETFVVVIRDPGMATVRGTWTLTSRGHHNVYEGDLTLTIAEAPDVAEDIEAHLGRLG